MSEVIAHGSLADGTAIRSYRPRVAVPFGGGLDRTSATLAASREVARDLVNLIPREGKVRLRDGIEAIATLDEGYDVICGKWFITESASIVVGYEASTRELVVFRVSPDGLTVANLGTWGVLAAGARTPPRVIMTEFQDRMFIAHDERLPTRRLGTIFWDPFASSLLPLEADWRDLFATEDFWVADTVYEVDDVVRNGLDLYVCVIAGTSAASGGPTGQGAAIVDGTVTWDWVSEEPYSPISFRGVTTHLAYLVGWGYNSPEADGADMIRVSLPGLPVKADGTAGFDFDHYDRAGNPADPIILCIPAGQVLLACKQTRTYPFAGFSAATFGVGPTADHRFGVLSAHLGIHHMGQAYLWTSEGPRVTSGGPLEDLELPLDIAGPQPRDLVAEGALVEGFSVYLPHQRQLIWVFGARAYSLSLREPGRLRWAYWEFGGGHGQGVVPMQFGWVAQTADETGELPATPSPGTPIWDSEVPDDTSVAVRVENDGHLGDEFIEVWLEGTGGAWYQARQAHASLQQFQTINVPELDPGRGYNGALRYRRGAGLYHGDYLNPDPSQWPVASQGNFVTLLNAPTNLQGAWSRTSDVAEQVHITWDDAYLAVDLEVRINAGAWVPVAAGVQEHTFTTILAEDSNVVEIRHVTAEAQSAIVSTTVYGGPPAPYWLHFSWVTGCSYTANWIRAEGEPDMVTEVWDDYPGGMHTLRGTSGVNDTDLLVEHGHEVLCAGGIWIPVSVRVRNKLTSFGVDDFSPFFQRDTLELCDTCTWV